MNYRFHDNIIQCKHSNDGVVLVMSKFNKPNILSNVHKICACMNNHNVQHFNMKKLLN